MSVFNGITCIEKDFLGFGKYLVLKNFSENHNIELKETRIVLDENLY